MPPHREDFARWQDDPVTRWVMRGLLQRVEHQKEEWIGLSWVNGGANPHTLNELRTRASAWVELADADYEHWCNVLGEEPRDE